MAQQKRSSIFDPRYAFDNVHDLEQSKVIWCSDSAQIAYDAMQDSTPLRHKPFYRDDIYLRKANLIFRMSKQEQREFVKCKLDILYFARSYINIDNENDDVELIKLREYQERLLLSYQHHKYTIVLSGRQLGKTVTTAIFLLWVSIFHNRLTIAMLGDTHKTAMENLSKARTMVQRMPFFLKPGVHTWNTMTASFDNGSRIITGPAKKNSVVGKSINVLYIDELAIPPPQQSFNLVMYAFPTIESKINGKIIVTSTPSGDNIFKDLWFAALNKVNKFNAVQINWWEVPGRDLAWKKDMIDMYGIDGFNEQFNCTFLSASRAYYNQDTIEYIEQNIANYTQYKLDGLDSILHKVIDPSGRATTETEPNNFMWYRDDIELSSLRDEHIIIEIDIAEGLLQDFSVANIFRLNKRASKQLKPSKQYNLAPGTEAIKDYISSIDEDIEDGFADDLTTGVYLEQIALFHSNETSLPVFATYIKHLVNKIFNQNNLRIVVEHNKYGGHFINILLLDTNDAYAIDYESIGKTYYDGKVKDGVHMTSKTKNLYVKESKIKLETGTIEINEQRTLNELKYFGKVNNSYAATSGHDDISMTIVGLSGYASIDNDDYLTFIESFLYNDSDNEFDEYDTLDYAAAQEIRKTIRLDKLRQS